MEERRLVFTLIFFKEVCLQGVKGGNGRIYGRVNVALEVGKEEELCFILFCTVWLGVE